MTRRALPAFCALALATLCAAQTVRSADSQPGSKTPRVTAVLDGPRTAVFETPQDSCNPNDIPDAMARAFRDSTGTIHFVAASSEMFASLGPTLENLVHSCEVAHYSANDPNPADYNDQTWLDSFYTFDGVHIAALTHTEYHGWAHPGECHSQNYGECEYDSDTYHLSNDGGYHFNSFKAPANYLAGIPYKYEIDRGPAGYSVDSNVVAYGGWYYAIATSWTWPPNCGQAGHRCITSGGAPIRTADVFDPSSWTTWNGTDFSATFVDPYLDPVAHPEQHVFTPVPYMFAANGLNVYSTSNVVVATLWDYWDDELGPRGLYLTTSTDLVHWTAPTLVVTLADILKNDPKGSWLYAYFSLIDPSAPDLSFSVIGDHPYLYYVRLDNNGQDRVLYRQAITLTPID
ncbi:MAG TPA: hypothetical protein VJK27_09760 [Terriglobales bacterium]|nr:hypothetical protein [Terriglobales bacterium]